jgi:hypothetical protein
MIILNNSCHAGDTIYTWQVRLKWKFVSLAIPALLMLLCAGCGGINTSGSVSPASFFLPGIMRNDAPPATNNPVAFAETSFAEDSIQ